MGFWDSKNYIMRKAEQHTKDMAEKYSDEILHSIRHTNIYDKNFVPETSASVSPEIIIDELDSISAAQKHQMGRTCILNFASYKHPGGGFANGALAQEETLCHNSFLYNVLKHFSGFYSENRNNINDNLYTDRALYSPDIIFVDGCKVNTFDVLTCAAPNLDSARRSDTLTSEDNRKALVSRTNFILGILDKEKVDTAILGAWGCGVFGQNPIEVATIFKQAIDQQEHAIEKVVFAIPGGDNYKAFHKIFSN